MAKNLTKFIWDYNLKKSNVDNPTIKKWLLARQLFFGNLNGITLADLKKYLPNLDINRSLKELLTNFIKSHD
ncbi:hypothetical protein COU24_00790 [Candidatus Kuenenbacteria bacterium CG10_big_fil_rev_8_21_14_0_10_39_14]|uniref:Uncharacterized protein n=4 Tax=Candidatus Kueneniibacteriota TaxID=1752740 RepID=A0A2M7MGE4_9BACT|nr:hypothetical protein [Candidatus Kuenenbacteria bacterium]OIP56173.1 MAG: hypothetical protein AUK13_01570 [Candidatus Kuenenbacteria bacterium CG2_30_39_24]PIP75842.1 MAG: hypothetical protein COW86_01465 [Candidatus Kuenenbacteria bacterium CG22_combo_CG10-13_8_21_14_all_39_9]PIR81025.1 MAG: hypothetical protein COU24_00790 [Candidatus Kuenenbacteria bacterium CG10_big_fil_rev_8_21_14_0_10_39_14]PIX92191.1 MAG: hypothetical protein COZ26_03135 [Candidatus Kuenenbacteria bacterium CG_4_10_1